MPSVGIHVSWDLIGNSSRAECLSGTEAWSKIYNFYTPWFKEPKTFSYLFENKDSDYLQIIGEEKDNGKIEYYKNVGLLEPNFCAFGNTEGTFILLGDGNHRFIDCNHLIFEGASFEKYIINTTLDILYLSDFEEVIVPGNIWPTQSEQTWR